MTAALAAAARQRATEALQRLHATGQPITFTHVARTASVSRSWLYFPRWGASQLAAYLCAMKADRDALRRNPDSGGGTRGSATWFRQADWFNATNTNFKMPEDHIAYPFSTMTIQRGLRELRSEGLIQAHRTIRNPETGRRFTTGPRMIYTNQFHKLPTHSVPFS